MNVVDEGMIGELNKTVHELEKIVHGHGRDILHMSEKVGDIESSILKIFEKLDAALKKPSWAVAVIITFLSSLSIGLIVYVLGVVGK